MTEISGPKRKLLPKGRPYALKQLTPPTSGIVAAPMATTKRPRGRPPKNSTFCPIESTVSASVTGASVINDWDRVREENMQRNAEFLKQLGIDQVRNDITVGSKRTHHQLSRKGKPYESDPSSECSSESSSEDSCNSEMSSLSDTSDMSYKEVPHPDGKGKDHFWDYIGSSFRDLSNGNWESWRILAVAYSSRLNTYLWKYVPLEKHDPNMSDDEVNAEYTPCEELLHEDEATVQWLPRDGNYIVANRIIKSPASGIEEPKKRKRGRPRKS